MCFENTMGKREIFTRLDNFPPFPLNLKLSSAVFEFGGV